MNNVESLEPSLRLGTARTTRPILRTFVLMWEHPVSAALLALVSYWCFALFVSGGGMYQATDTGYHNYLADAWLHGQLHLRIIPPRTTVDLAYYQDKLYLYWGPLSAFVMLPFVWLFGHNVSDTLVQISIGSVNTLLVASLLRAAVRADLFYLSPERRGILTAVFTLGTTCAVQMASASVWSIAVVLACTCVLFAYLSAIQLSGWKAFLCCGCGVGATILARNHVVLACLWPCLYLLAQHRFAGWQRLCGYLGLLVLPVALAITVVGAYNTARFGNPLINGTQYQFINPQLPELGYNAGLFSFSYLPRNFFYHFLAYPLPVRAESVFGGSLFLLTPVFFAALWTLYKQWRTWIVGALCLSIVLVLVPDLIIMGGGWIQFGPRYSVDYMVPLLLLTGAGLQRWSSRLLLVCACISIVHYVVGVTLLR